MAYYTVQLRTICESLLGYSEPQPYSQIDNVITNSAPLVFDFDFPIWDENYRLTLEKKIIKHFYMKEIGAETVGQWKLWLDDKLNVIMPYYNKLYATTTYDFNPFYDVDLTTDHSGNATTKRSNLFNERYEDNISESGNNSRDIDRKSSGLENQRSENTSSENNTLNSNRKNSGLENERNIGKSETVDSNKSRFSDTPQGALTDIENNKYLTNATLDDGETVVDTTQKNSRVNQSTEDTSQQGNRNTTGDEKRSSVTQNDEKISESLNNQSAKTDEMKKSHVGQEQIGNVDSYIQHVVGTNGNRTYAAKILEFRKTLLNIDAMILEELSDLFMGLWG